MHFNEHGIPRSRYLKPISLLYHGTCGALINGLLHEIMAVVFLPLERPKELGLGYSS